MTISSTNRKAGPFIGNGSASVFAFSFRVFAASDLEVVRITLATGVETTLTINSAYTVSLNADQNSNPGGSITLTGGALASGYNLIITSDIANLQPTDLTNQGGFYPEVITGALDRATIQIQQLDEHVSRTLSYPITDPTVGTELPPLEQRKGTVLAFDETTGAPEAGPSVGAILTVSGNIAAINTVANDLNEPVSEIETVAGSIANVNTVGTNIANVNTTAASIGNVNTVGTNIASVNSVASNIVAVQGASNNASAAAASAAAAASSAASASSSASLALTAKNNAVAAAEASGAIAFYDTKSAANAALAGLAANQVVEVLADESREGRRTRYRKESGVYVFKLYLDSIINVYVDSAAADDSADGLSPTTAKKTLSAGCAVCKSSGFLNLKRGSRWFEPIPINALPSYVRVRSYGTGPRPILDGSRPVTQGSISVNPTHATVYQVDITHAGVLQNITGSVTAGSPHFFMWRENDAINHERLIPYWAGADIAANIAYVAANPGSCTVHQVGSTIKDPRIDTTGTKQVYRYYFSLSDGTDPRSGTSRIYYAEQIQNLALSVGCSIEDVIIQRTATKDMAGNHGSLCNEMVRCDLLEAAIHGFVGPINFRDCYGKGLPSSRALGGGCFHNYYSTAQLGTTPGYEHWNCTAEAFNHGFYSHGNGGPPEHQFISILNGKAIDCAAFVSAGNTVRGYYLKNVQAIRCPTFVVSAVGGMTVENFYWYSDVFTNNFAFGARCYNDINFVNGCLHFDETIPTTYRWTVENPGSTERKISFDRVTVINGGFATSGGDRLKISWTIKNSIFGPLPGGFAVIASAINSYFSNQQVTLAELQVSRPTISNDCLVNCVAQEHQIVASENDITWFNVPSARTVSFNSGSDVVTATTQDFAYLNNIIRIVNFDGAGNDFSSRVVEVITTGVGGQFRVASPLTASSSGKTPQRGYWNKVLFPQDAATATPTNASGTNITFSNPRILSSGMTIYLSAFQNGEEDPGIRKILTFNQTTGEGTIDRGIVPLQPLQYSANIGVAPAQSYPVKFGFWSRWLSGSLSGPELTITQPDGTVITSVEEPNTANFVLTSGFTASGTSRPYARIRHPEGFIDEGFQVQPNGTLNVKQVGYVRAYEPRYVGDPLALKAAVLARGHELWRRGMGMTAFL